MQLLSLLSAFVNQNEVEIPQGGLTSHSVLSALQLVFGIAGAVTLLVITVAGIQYVMSMGDPQNTTRARNTIIYALVGLVICISAFSIVTFALNHL